MSFMSDGLWFPRLLSVGVLLALIIIAVRALISMGHPPNHDHPKNHTKP